MVSKQILGGEAYYLFSLFLLSLFSYIKIDVTYILQRDAPHIQWT